MAPAMPQTISEPVEEVDHRQITGIVTDRKGEPIAGATVQMKEDTRKIVATGPDGDFTMTDVQTHAPCRFLMWVIHLRR